MVFKHILNLYMTKVLVQNDAKNTIVDKNFFGSLDLKRATPLKKLFLISSNKDAETRANNRLKPSCSNSVFG